MKYCSSVLGVFKNEATFIAEWIDHYLNRNIDHIYLLNDDSSDDFYERIYRHVEKTRGSCNNSNILRDEKMYKLLNMNEVLDERLVWQSSEHKQYYNCEK